MKKLFFIIISVMFIFFSCKTERQERIEEAAEEMEEAAEKIAEAAEKMAEQLEESIGENAENLEDAMDKFGSAMSGNSKIKAVNYRELKNLLPLKAAGLLKQKSQGETNTTMGINISEAEAMYYIDDEDSEIKIKIVDMGSMSGFMKMGSIGWAMSDFDRETSSGFERTVKIEGHKAFEKYNSNKERGEISIIVAERFLVEIKSRYMRFKDIKQVAADFDFIALIDLAEDTVLN